MVTKVGPVLWKGQHNKIKSHDLQLAKHSDEYVKVNIAWSGNARAAAPAHRIVNIRVMRREHVLFKALGTPIPISRSVFLTDVIVVLLFNLRFFLNFVNLDHQFTIQRDLGLIFWIRLL